MHWIDLAIIVLYLAMVVGSGFYFGARQQSTSRYFLGGHQVPWWAISASIVATETSTVTFISVPGIVYASRGDFRFLQIVFGYIVARVVISVLFMPAYFRRELVTVYELLQERFGGGVKALAATLFVVMRTVADGVRLLLTGFVLAAVVQSLNIADKAVPGSVIGIGLVMIVFTLYGGIEAIVWVEVVLSPGVPGYSNGWILARDGQGMLPSEGLVLRTHDNLLISATTEGMTILRQRLHANGKERR